MSNDNDFLPDIHHEIDIPLPGQVPEGEPSPSSRLKNHRIELMKQWVNIIATTAALVTAIAAVLKPNDPINKTSYKEIAKTVEEQSKAIQQNHDDLVALHNYLDGYFKGTGTTLSLPPMSSSPIMTVPIQVKIPVTSSSSYPVGSQTIVISKSPPPPLPDMHPRPEPQRLPNYDQLKLSLVF